MRVLADADTIDKGDTVFREIARGADWLRSVDSIVYNMIANGRSNLFNDEIIAVTRGLLHSLAEQLNLANVNERPHPLHLRDTTETDATMSTLSQNADLVSFCHNLALEFICLRNLQEQLGLDPALPPIIQNSIGSDAGPLAPLAMKLVTAQSRFMQQLTQMRLSLYELPGELLHQILCDWRTVGECEAIASKAKVEASIRRNYNEADSRLALLDRLSSEITTHHPAQFSILHLGLSLFVSRIASETNQSRSQIVLLLDGTQHVRMLVTMIAAGMKQDDAQRNYATIFGDQAEAPFAGKLSSEQAIAMIQTNSDATHIYQGAGQ